jgi:hypothetical protein
MALLNYDKIEVVKKRPIKRKRKTVEEDNSFCEESCFTVGKRKWLIKKQIGSDLFIISWRDSKNQYASTQLVTLQDIRDKRVRFIDYLQYKKPVEKSGYKRKE